MASSITEDSPTSDFTFRGTDGDECETFVAAMWNLAYKKGKRTDEKWIVHNATTRLRGKALRWYAKLDWGVQNDWYLFVKAIFEEYPPIEDNDNKDDGMATPVWSSTTFSPRTTATFLDKVSEQKSELQLSNSPCEAVVPAPRPYSPAKLSGYQLGRLKIIYDDVQLGTHYVRSGNEGPDGHCLRVTDDVHEALIACPFRTDKTRQILCMKSDRSGWNLAVRLYPVQQANFHPLAESLSPSEPLGRAGFSQFYYQEVSIIWEVLGNGTLQAQLVDLEDRREGSLYSQKLGVSWSSTSVYVEVSGASVSFVSDTTARDRPDYHPVTKRPVVPAHIVFEPLTVSRRGCDKLNAIEKDDYERSTFPVNELQSGPGR